MSENSSSLNRRQFLGTMTAAGAAAALPITKLFADAKTPHPIIKPPRLRNGDTIGIIAPASGIFEASTIIEAREAMECLGFKTKLGQNLRRRHGYLAGTDAERLDDLHTMFADDSVRAIITIRGGYGSGRLLSHIDYELIRKNPKIIVGYSDITALHLGLHRMTGLVTFHGPVAISSFNDYSTQYFKKALMEAAPVGEVEDVPLGHLRKTTNVQTVVPGKASGPLIGGNLTITTSLMGTPFEADLQGKIVFLEEVGEEPYDMDRMLTQLLNSGKLQQAAGIIIDKCSRCQPRDYKPGFSNTFSTEEVIFERLGQLSCPVLYGLSLGHVADKPTLPLGITAEINSKTGRLTISESAVS
ncbi:LD-carboxypeptidase [bacterium]|nr:LD-carboxypeptidase [bacterium]